MNQKSILFITLGALLIAFGGAAYWYNAKQAAEKTALASNNSEALEQFHSPRVGSPSAKVTIVEFMDPACETCSAFHDAVKATMKQYQGKVKLVIRYAPFHPGSDKAVEILEASRNLGKFNDVLDLMYGTQHGWASHHNPQPELIWEYLAYYKFDVAALKKNVDSVATAKLIAIDLADAKTLGVNKTPTFFVNGKPLPSFGYEQFQKLVADEVAAAYNK
ncbi:DsbA family protein [Ghiorsea bivora]|uniref:DsbA family protein n=1 Tax=Ghiorsea bivora TaxID=1485545 RepID=UPI00056F3415|nr:thioredoxin domain-containing protein [Ghiorsea bivora]